MKRKWTKGCKWNKVRVTAWNMSNHKFSVYYIAPEDYLVGDSVTIHTCRGTYPGIIKEIVSTDVYHYEANAKIDRRDSVDDLQTNSNKQRSNEQEESNMMINDLFTIVTVKHSRSGKTNNLYTTLEVQEGDTVVFTTDIRPEKNSEFINAPQWHGQFVEAYNMHVGVVIAVFTPEAIDRPTINSAHFSYVTQIINAKQMYDDYDKYTEAVQIVNGLNKIKKQFEARKIYEILANSDPDAKAMLNRLDELSGKKS